MDRCVAYTYLQQPAEPALQEEDLLTLDIRKPLHRLDEGTGFEVSSRLAAHEKFEFGHRYYMLSNQM